MQPLKAHVRNGRLLLDEPTDLPNGEVVVLVPISGDDDMDAHDRAALQASLLESIEQMNGGQLIDADKALAELRAHGRGSALRRGRWRRPSESRPGGVRTALPPRTCSTMK